MPRRPVCRLYSLRPPSHSCPAADPLLTTRGRFCPTPVRRGSGPAPMRAPLRARPDVPDDPPAPARWALLESVDGCLLGTTLPRHSEVGPCRLPPLRGRGPADGTLPLRGPDHTLRQRPGARPRCGGRPLGKLSGGNRMAGRALCSIAPGPGRSGPSRPLQRTALPRSRGVAAASSPRRSR